MKKLLIVSLTAFLALQNTLVSQEIITNPARSDGFGAQFQTVIYSAILAELSGKEFRYTPFKEMEHNYNNDPEFIQKKENLINFIGNFKINTDATIQAKTNVGDVITFYERNLKECENSAALKRIKKIFRANKNKSDYFDDNHFHIAMHVRRPNAHDSRIAGADTPDQVHLDAMSHLRSVYSSKKLLFHIFSQGDIETFKSIYKGDDIVLHINEPIETTFASMVFADALVTTSSSFSHCAGVLSEGTVYYIPFWHPPLPSWILLKS